MTHQPARPDFVDLYSSGAGGPMPAADFVAPLLAAVEALQDETAAELGIPVSLLRYRPRPPAGGSVQPPAEVLAAQAAFDGGNGGLSPLEAWHNRQMIRRMPH